MFTQQQTILRERGNGLLMRHATREDVEALSEFNANIHGEDDADRRAVAAWTRDLLTRPHATFQSGDFIIYFLLGSPHFRINGWSSSPKHG
jgi:hypothetical protein